MYRKHRSSIILLAVSLILMSLLMASFAQQREINPVGRIKIQTKEVETPEFDVRNFQTERADDRWFEISVDYETVVDWVDEIEFVFYMFADTNIRETPKMLLTHSLSYVDIEKGTHKCSIYMHPNTFKRYIDDVQFVGVELRYKGRPVRWTSDKSNMADSQWWEQARQQFPPVAGKLMAREHSPFALINIGEYEQIKRTEQR
jgi:uncharacterized protein (UPF0212 family)